MSEKDLRVGPAYRIHTPNLVIRCWEPADAVALKEAVEGNLEHLTPWMPWAREQDSSLEERVRLLRSFRAKFDLDEDYFLGIFSPGDGRLIGGTGLHLRRDPESREIGYWITRDQLGKGYAAEATKALIRIAFEIERVRRIELRVVPENVHSLAIPKRLGLCHEGTLRAEHRLGPSDFRDVTIWSMLEREYLESPIRQFPVEAFDVLGVRLPFLAASLADD